MVTKMTIDDYNIALKDKTPEAIIEWTISQSKRPVITTSFSPFSAVLLHMATQIKPDISVIWVDNGYNTNATYRYVKKLHQQLNLNLHVYAPAVTTAYRDAVLGGIPDISEESAHAEFTESVKLAPFRLAMKEMQPDAWINGIRKEETEFRKSLNIITTTQDNIMKVAPLFFWQEGQLREYIDAHQLPNEMNYYDPTKATDDRECGLHFQI